MIELTGRIVKEPQALDGAMFAVPGATSLGELQETTIIPMTEEQKVTPDIGYAGFSAVTVTPVELQEKTVTPKDAQQIVKASEGYHGLSAVTVEGVTMQAKTVTPTATTEQTVTADEGYSGLSAVTIERLPSAEEAYFGGTEIEEEYAIQGETMDNIAKAIQTKKETTAIFTPAQMAAEIESIVVGDELPNAEGVAFGTVDSYEYAISLENFPSQFTNSLGARAGSYGAAFVVNTAFSVAGFQIKQYSGYSSTVQLWDISGGIKLASVPSSTGGTTEVMLDSPVNLEAGKTYAVVQYSSSNRPYYGSGTLTINEKITNTAQVYSSTATADSAPPISTTKGWYCGVNLIMTEVITESVVTEYKIQTNTLTDIANEVIRIAGATGTLTPAQIITALQGIEAPTTE